jgi:hypothetical protein
MMAKYKSDDYGQLMMITVALERQLMPGMMEFPAHELV